MWGVLLALVVGTWNGNWFPSGRAEHRAHPDVEAATISAAGKMIAEGLGKIDPSGKEEVVFSLCEIRNRDVAEKLAQAIGRKGLKVVAVSGYRRRDRFDQQQDVIMTTLPTVNFGWSAFGGANEVRPPRGYAFADLLIEPAVTSRFYAVHLKSDYGATTKAIAETNRRKREEAMRQCLADVRDRRAVIAGDFNADRYRCDLTHEKVFAALGEAEFTDCLERLSAEARGTCPNKRFGDKTLDYVMVRGFECIGKPLIQANEGLSDHYAVFVRLKPSSQAAEPRDTSPKPVRKRASRKSRKA